MRFNQFLEEKMNFYLEASTSSLVNKITNMDLRKILPNFKGDVSNVIFFCFDTETTGLNFKQDDVITEIAVLAFDSNFNNLSKRYHSKIQRLPEQKDPEQLFKKAVNELDEKFKEVDKRDIRQSLINFIKDYIKSEGDMYPIIDKHFQEFTQNHNINPNDKRLRSFYFAIITKLTKSVDLKKVLQMTQFKTVQTDVEDETEEEMATKTAKFINETIKEYGGESVVPIAIAHNYAYDYTMLKQASERAGVEYPFQYFIDTAHFARAVTNKIILATFLYYKKLYEKTGKERYKDIATKLEPNKNNRMGTLAEYFQIPNLNWHTAKNDVEATFEIFKYLVSLNSRFLKFVRSNFKRKQKNSIKIFREVKNELQEIGVDRKSALKPQTDPYRKYHNQVYNEFLGKEEETSKDKKSKQGESKEEKRIREKEEIEQKYPGVGDISSFDKEKRKKKNKKKKEKDSRERISDNLGKDDMEKYSII